MGNHHRYTKHELEWLLENYNNYEKVSELTDVFNSIFLTKLSVSAIRQVCKARLNIMFGKSQQQYTEAEDAWLKNNANSMSYKELGKLFCELFEHPVTHYGLKCHCYQLGIKSENPYKFAYDWKRLPVGTE